MHSNQTIDVVAPQADFAFDAARTFVGPHASYYDETWRQMAWRGRQTSWNRHAALYGPFWFAYRRLRLVALASVLWLLLWLELWRHGWSPWLLCGLQLAAMLVQGTFANRLYLGRFTALGRRLERSLVDAAARERAMARTGGVSRRDVVAAMLALALGLALLELRR
ncbi:MAG: hypothetical protein H6852_01880 [Geminicoccaceae bacterium]|jgi:hypothetical protein|nr:hypothetical protein [Geminicoccaceae bacterium]MCB9966370.1 hypothetical protein [Geminicoccaceae bacterium]HRY23327.1 hypothetical protein [Geminicoccaceae bacterium]